MPHKWIYLLIGATTVVWPRNGPQAQASPECIPHPEVRGFAVGGYGWVGTFQLTLVATAGPKSGAEATGRLVLDTVPDSVKAYRKRHYSDWQSLTWFGRFEGTTDVPLAVVGAGGARPGTDPNPFAPPVALGFGSDPPWVGITIGSKAPPATASSATILERSPATYLESSSGTGSWYQGTWSYDPTGAAGYFCAVRITQ